MATTGESKMQDILAEGRKLLENDENSNNNQEALRLLVKAVNMCPCDPAGEGKARHGKDKSCHISQCAAAVQSKDPDALYKVATTGTCLCGYIWPSCDRPLHALALDTQAECLDKGAQHVQALSTALSIIRLDPSSSVGYCRVGVILKKLLKHSEQPTSAAGRALAVIARYAKLPSTDRVESLLRRFVRTGLYNGEHHRNHTSDTYDVVLQRMAYALNLNEARRDPVKKFPHEVLTMIFRELDLKGLIKCLRVSKQWYQVVLRDRALWANLTLGRPSNPRQVFAKFLQHHQEIRSFVVRDGTHFALNAEKLGYLLHGLPRLKRLYLDAGIPHRLQGAGWPGTGAEVKKTGCRLAQLSLVGYRNQSPFRGFMKSACDTLVVLDLVDTSDGMFETFERFCFPKLKKLRIIEKDEPAHLEMEPIVVATPNLEELVLDGYIVSWRQGQGASVAKDHLWPALQKLMLGSQTNFLQIPVYSYWESRFIPPLTKNIRSIEILCDSVEISHNVLFAVDAPHQHGQQPHPPHPTPSPHALHTATDASPLPNVRVFRCATAFFDLGLLRRRLEPAARAGTLEVLELTAQRHWTFPHISPPGQGALQIITDPADQLDFLTSANLHTLGLHDFNFAHDPTDPWGTSTAFNGQPFFEWLRGFPKLRTVAVYPGNYLGVEAFVMQLILLKQVREVRQCYLRGVAWDEGLTLAEKHGVALMHVEGPWSVRLRLLEEEE